MADELTGSARSAGTTLDSCKVADVSKSQAQSRPAPSTNPSTVRTPSTGPSCSTGFPRGTQGGLYLQLLVFKGDVDLVPMDERNLYRCGDQPRHFAIAMDKFGFR